MSMARNSEKQRRKASQKSTQTVGFLSSPWSAYVAIDFCSNQGALADDLGESNAHQQKAQLRLLGDEATWHTWLEPSDATSCLGIAVAQVSGLSKAVQPNHYRVLRYTACICQAISVVILLTGTYRFSEYRPLSVGKVRELPNEVYWSLAFWSSYHTLLALTP